MIDFKNAEYLKLTQIKDEKAEKELSKILLDGETIMCAFKSIRDSVVFTSHRIIAVNVQGITGKKVDYTSLPYSKIQAFSTETAGVFDLDGELEIWFSGLGRVKFEFSRGVDIAMLNKLIAKACL